MQIENNKIFPDLEFLKCSQRQISTTVNLLIRRNVYQYSIIPNVALQAYVDDYPEIVDDWFKEFWKNSYWSVIVGMYVCNSELQIKNLRNSFYNWIELNPVWAIKMLANKYPQEQIIYYW